MSYIVSARKYRPQQFEEVLGQSHVSSTLAKALDADKIAHAYLFCGPRGVGKTSCARIMAKVLNCENKPNPHTACNECPSCKAFNENASFNIIELDAASNNSVENIRTLIEQVRFRPQQGQYKIFIIDEVHMLSTSAFNAFLKTLEEPPPYAIFILATTEKHKIIPTILSRCQVFDFKRIQTSDMVEQLKMIAEAEGKDYEVEGLHIIAQKADGAMRDALSIFDRIASTGDAITYKQVVESLNILDYDTFFRLVDALMAEDIGSILLQFSDIIRRGFDPDHFINGLAGHFRNLLVAKEQSTVSLLDLSDQLKSKYITQSKLLSADFLLTAMNIANQCDINYAKAKNKNLHTEIALCKMAKINRAIDLKKQTKTEDYKELKTANKQTAQQSYTATLAPSTENPTDDITQKTVTVLHKEKPSIKRLPKINSLEELVMQVAEEEARNADAGEEMTDENLERLWNEYVSSVESQATASSLKNTIVRFEGKSVHAIVPSQIAKETLLQEIPLIEKIRKNFNVNDLPLNIEVDITQFPDFAVAEKPKHLGPRERYEKLVEVNPLVADLVKKFDLKLDNE
ncbi:DNA polymerase III subunit gamma/tau [Portibacter marinus]|uniref:DNA polymerase III subunit gamma/tau n=1 Tax=Portibacter marinus TaxID=2898660 RepID=UPI001F3BEB8C|nr:DNA polymerase III subunit gamma/tau [Portibacter marinus]